MPRIPDFLSPRRVAGRLALGALGGLATAGAPLPFDVVLGSPTDRSVEVSLRADENLRARLRYGPASSPALLATEPWALAAHQPHTISLTGLEPDTPYQFLVEYADRDQPLYAASPAASFHTCRAPEAEFTLAVQADLHFRDPGSYDPAVYAATAANLLADQPDFLIDLGDTFMTEKFLPDPTTPEELDDWAAQLRGECLGRIGGSIPLLLATGNHESELGWLISRNAPGDNRAVWSSRVRERYFPGPRVGPPPEHFHRGASESDPALGVPRNSYYAFRWGAALCIVLDPFWYTPVKPAPGKVDPWAWTLGAAQYQWLHDLLAENSAPFTFVFIHHLVGGSPDGKGRGGLEAARLFEWGGYDPDGTYRFDELRPGWGRPIQDLLLEGGVQVVFHGHDHFFAHQDLDANGDGLADLTYLLCPQPASRIPDTHRQAEAYGYLSTTPDTSGRSGLAGGSGHLRVRVSAQSATVEFVRAYAEADRGVTRVNGSVAHAFTLEPPTRPFPGTILLGRPSDTSVAANLWCPGEDGEAYLTWGPEGQPDSGRSPTVALRGGEPAEVTLNGLVPQTRHHYRVWYKAEGEPSFRPGPEASCQTRRAPGQTFTFTIQGDSHPERRQQFDPDLYRRTLTTAAGDQPDFHILMGDDFSVDTLDPATLTQAQVVERYTLQRPYLGLLADRVPLFLVNGNHEQAARYLLDGTPENVAVWAQNARHRFYPQPGPDDFYRGNPEQVPHIGLLRNYFSWTWGDALFVVLDPYWSSPTCIDEPFGGGPKRSDVWDVHHGDEQYQWLTETLAQSPARHKFVFAHHVLGTGRGGIELAPFYEWGGRGPKGAWELSSHRPLWPKPIHQLLVEHEVTIFFQGHDHVWVRQELDGVVYQTLSQPADPNYALYNAEAFLSGDMLPNSGYTRVRVAPAGVRVEYVRTWRPSEESPDQVSGTVAFAYTAGAPPTPWGPLQAGWQWSPLGWAHDAHYPFVYLWNARCFAYVHPASTAAGTFAFFFLGDGFWTFSGPAWPGWVYHFGSPRPGWQAWAPDPPLS